MYDVVSREQKAKRILKTLQSFLGKEKLKSLTLLDIGSSTGIIDNALAKHFKKVTGVDIDKDAIDFAKKNFRQRNLEFKTEDALNLSFKNNSFDIVICTHVYEHVPSPQKLFSEIFRVLRPGGVCYLAAQNKLWPWEPHYNLPFLSWLPKPLANIYVRLFGKADEYYESPKAYWGLKRLTRKFKVHDITPKILIDPSKYGYENALRPPLTFAARILSPLAKYLSPTFFWLLEK